MSGKGKPKDLVGRFVAVIVVLLIPTKRGFIVARNAKLATDSSE
jgi:hypothetical protein